MSSNEHRALVHVGVPIDERGLEERGLLRHGALLGLRPERPERGQLILGGSEALAATLAGSPPLPERETWSDLEEFSLFPELSRELKRRFKQSIYDLTGADYPYPWTRSSTFKHVDYLETPQAISG